MMDSNLQVMLQLLLIAGVWWLFAFGYCRYRTDAVRQYLFEIRDNLFHEAAARDLFSTEAYGLTRTTLNGMIRFAHEMTLSRFLLLVIFRRWSGALDNGKAYVVRVNDALRGLAPDDQKLFLRVHTLANYQLVTYMVRTSLLVGPLVFVVLVVLKALRQSQRALIAATAGTTAREGLAAIDAEANEIGEQVAAPA